MNDLLLAFKLAIVVALTTNHCSNAVCTEGSVVLNDGESRMVGCYKYICSGSKLTKKDYYPIICGAAEPICCPHGSTFVNKIINGCTCSWEECKEGSYWEKLKNWWSSDCK